MLTRRRESKSVVSAPECGKREKSPGSTTEYSVLRIKKYKHGWIPVPRTLINDRRLRFDTRGFAQWLIAKPPGWEIRVGVLPHLLKDHAGPGERIGRDKLRRYLRELEMAGYLTRTRSRKPDGRWVWHIEFSDRPDTATIDGLAVDGSAVDGQGVDILNTQDYSRLDNSIPTTTSATAATAPGDESVVVGFIVEIKYPEVLAGALLVSAQKLIEDCPAGQRQAVLDEIGAMEAQGTVKSPLGLLSSLVRKAKKGEFIPNHGLALYQRQRAETPVRERQPVRQRTQHSPAPVALSEIGHSTLQRLREKWKPCRN